MLNPKPFLGDLIGSPCAVRLKWHGLEYQGILHAVDSYMNIQLREAVEIVDGNKGLVGDILVRCNNVLYVRDMRGISQDAPEQHNSNKDSVERDETMQDYSGGNDYNDNGGEEEEQDARMD